MHCCRLLKWILRGTILNYDYQCITVLQHCGDIVLNNYCYIAPSLLPLKSTLQIVLCNITMIKFTPKQFCFFLETLSV